MESPAADQDVPLHVRERGAVSLFILVRGAGSASVTLLVNGEGWPSVVAPGSGEAGFRVPLTHDFERHLVTCTVGARFALTLSAVRERQVGFKGKNGQEFLLSKWTPTQFRHALDEWRGFQRARRGGEPTRAGRDETGRALVARQGQRGDGDVRQALHEVCLRLASLVRSLRRQDLLPEYGRRDQPELDLHSTLEGLKANPRLLMRSNTGPIRVGDDRFTTRSLVWTERAGGTLDLQVPIHLLRVTGRGATQAAATGSAMLLAGTIARLAELQGVAPRRRVGQSDVDAWRMEPPTSKRSARFRDLVQQALALATYRARRAEEQPGPLEGLDTTFTDYHLFQWWCARELCRALEADLKTLVRSGHASGPGGLRVSCPDWGGGAAVPCGWRDASPMRSDYRPDFVVEREGAAVVLDAKFRMGATLDQACSADSVKEVQSYMEEFGLPAAGILVPCIPGRVARGEAGLGREVVEGSLGARSRRIVVAECAPMDGEDCPANLRATVEALLGFGAAF
ncbi:MAG TPA: hypothetical protein VIL69_05810 [Roseomonas sp.]